MEECRLKIVFENKVATIANNLQSKLLNKI